MTNPGSDRSLRLIMPADGSDHGTYQPELTEILARFQTAVLRETVLDPVANELVRIRCAHVHDCRHCSSIRVRAAQRAGADEDLLAHVDFYETSELLSQRQKVVLRLADAHIFGSVPPGLPGQVALHLNPAEAVEVSLLVSKYSYQKPKVALGLDFVQGYEGIDFDPHTGEVMLRD